MRVDKLNIDRVFAHIGELGGQQKRYMFLLSLMNMFAPQFMIQYKFVGHDVNFRCYLENGTWIDNACLNGETSQCKKLEFDTSESDSINSEWNLVCENAWLSPISMTTFMSGVMTGSIILGAIADKIGRKKTLLITFFMVLLLNGISAAVTNFRLYLFLKFVIGFFKSGYILALFVLMNELIGSSKRGVMGTIMQSIFAIGIMIFSGMASVFTYWRSLTVVTTLFGLPIFIYGCWALPESPRWLLSKGNIKETIEVLKAIAKGNQTKWDQKLINDDTDSEDSEEEITIQPHLPPEARKPIAQDSLIDLLRHRFLLILTLIQVFAWFVNGLSYYGLTLAAGETSKGEAGSLYWATAMSGFVEIPAYAVMYLTLRFLGRTTNIMGFMVIGGLSMLVTPIFTSYHPGIITFLSLVGKLCISSSFAMIYIHSSEIFPTTIRNSAMGLVSVAARIGGMLAPFFAKLGSIYPNLHLILFGAMSLVSGLTALQLPETKDVDLPDNLQDLTMRKVHVVSVQSPAAHYKKVPIEAL